MRPASLFTFCALALLTTTARADFVTAPLPAAGGMPAFTGSAAMQSVSTLGVLNVRVDYTVFAPGTFPGSMTPLGSFPGLDPDHYVYAYQIYNLGALHAEADPGTLFVSRLNIGLFGVDIASVGYDPDMDASALDRLPNQGLLVLSDGLPDSAVFRFTNGNVIQPDQFSAVLLISSRWAPEYGSGSITGAGGASAHGAMPAPVVPLPSAAYAGLALLGGVLIRHRRRARRCR